MGILCSLNKTMCVRVGAPGGTSVLLIMSIASFGMKKKTLFVMKQY